MCSSDLKLQLDFTGGSAVFKDVFMQYKNLTFGAIKVGHFKEPFRLEVQTSSKYITFMERSLTTAFMPERSTGVMAHNSILDKRLVWSLGLFSNSDKYGDSEGSVDTYNLTGRLAGTPYKNDSTNSLLHVGAAFSVRNPGDDTYKISKIGRAHV